MKNCHLINGKQSLQIRNIGVLFVIAHLRMNWNTPGIVWYHYPKVENWHLITLKHYVIIAMHQNIIKHIPVWVIVGGWITFRKFFCKIFIICKTHLTLWQRQKSHQQKFVPTRKTRQKNMRAILGGSVAGSRKDRHMQSIPGSGSKDLFFLHNCYFVVGKVRLHQTLCKVTKERGWWRFVFNHVILCIALHGSDVK